MSHIRLSMKIQPTLKCFGCRFILSKTFYIKPIRRNFCFIYAELQTNPSNLTLRKCDFSTSSIYNGKEKDLLSFPNLNANTKWDVLFSFPHIKLLGIVSRFKMYQLAFIIVMSYPFYFTYLEKYTSDVLVTTAIVGGSLLGSGVLFIVFSYFATKVVGQLAVNQTDDVIRISRLTFYGRRTEDFAEVNKIIPMADLMEVNDLEKVFQKLCIKQGNKLDRYLYSLKYGKLVDGERFCRLLGVPHESLK